MSRPVLRASLLAAAVLLVQFAWILTLPPFQGIDEFDHAYRAAAVAHGQLLPSSRPVVDGRGDYVEVPAALVDAARRVCESYDYTGPDNCNPASRLSNGYVEVASAAARYNPVFYWVVGTPASLFSGSAFDYALRVVAALLCAAFVWCAGYALTVGFRTAWPLLGAALGMTPVLTYSMSLGAPNGVEMASGFALWSALLALRESRNPPRLERRLIALAAGSASVLATTRLLGPVWLLLLLLLALPFVGRDRLRGLVRRHRWPAGLGAALVLTALAAALLWTKVASPNSLAHEPDVGGHHPLTNALELVPLWIMQSIAAFPTRSEPAPTSVYAAVLLAAFLVLAAVARWVPRRWWGVLGVAVLVWLGAQVAITAATYEQLGAVWQGRYALPLGVGIPVLLGALAERHRQSGPPRALLAGVVALLTVAQAVSTAYVLMRVGTDGSGSWVTTPLVLVVVLAGMLLLAALALPGVRGRPAPLSRLPVVDEPALPTAVKEPV
jgi:hypothetical protein